jgi:bifunctional UDP-N-acetylglucosamine pyrophosphorylase/glucosamine-1-phosphate N-acetyltransferase
MADAHGLIVREVDRQAAGNLLRAPGVCPPPMLPRSNVVLGPGVKVHSGAQIRAFTHLEGCIAGPNCIMGPDARLRPGAERGEQVRVGNITCNYDGYNKHRTTIGVHAFIGSDIALVAPVTVGDGAIDAAGRVITEDVPPDALALARGRQANKPGRAPAMRKELQGKRR